MKEVKFLLLCVAWNVSVLLCFKVASLNLNVLFCFALPCKQVSAGCRDECGGTMCRQSDSTKGRYLCLTWHPELKSLCCKLQIFVTSKNVHAWLRRRSCFVLMIKMQQSPFRIRFEWWRIRSMWHPLTRQQSKENIRRAEWWGTFLTFIHGTEMSLVSHRTKGTKRELSTETNCLRLLKHFVRLKCIL